MVQIELEQLGAAKGNYCLTSHSAPSGREIYTLGDR
eukprot:gene22898-1383_t